MERELGVSLPRDYKRIVTGYAPVQVNVHLFLRRPSAERWNLGQWMKETVTAFTRSNLTDAQCPGFPEGPLFGGPDGLVPLASTDRGECLFGVADAPSGDRRLLACNGDEQDFHEYRMPFSEWLYRYFSGESMFGPGSAVFYPGPILFESLPMATSTPLTTWYGPER
ncbi:SMI1/KNR4 family protein [Streptomyces sp. NPDC051051]|uniref:SMI1/KNR4 family protein n=1 Tax=Streptomyces sp. NPDC051051 TaxID=3155666 RepID=UPI00343DDE57